MVAISQRAQGLGTENAFVVLAEVNQLIREGRDIISFCIGQPDFPTPTNIQDAGVKAIREGKHGYTASAGIPELRQAAADYLNRTRKAIQVDANDVVVAAGAKPFIGYSILSVTDYGAGDEVIVPSHTYIATWLAPLRLGCQLVACPVKESNLLMDEQQLANLVTGRTRCIMPVHLYGNVCDMKAILIREHGGPEVLKIEELPDPKASADQVVVAIKAVGVNPVDVYIRSGAYARKPTLPFTPGSDGAGEVEAVGADVKAWKPGDRVYIAGDNMSPPPATYRRPSTNTGMP